MSDQQRDRSAPFGTVYFGAFAAVIGLALTAAVGGTLGPTLAIGGTVLVGTGLVLRALHRIRQDFGAMRGSGTYPSGESSVT